MSSSVYAQSTGNINVQVNVNARAKLAIGTGTITFNDADPDVVTTFTSAPVSLDVKARTTRGWGGDADGAGGRELHERLVEHSAEHPAVDGDGHRLPGWLERQHKPADGGDVDRLGSPEWVAHVHAAQLLVVCDGHV